MSATETLRGLGACHEAVAWASAHGGSLAELWRDCPRGDWLLWYAGKARARREDLVRAARAADAATCAAYAADAAGARDKMRAACADVVRACVPFVEVVR